MEQTLRNAVTEERVGQWTSMMEHDLQQLVRQAAEIQQKINSAKTTTKRKYYEQKFKKTQNDVMSSLATLQRLREMSSKNNNKGDIDASTEQPVT
jgi:hypothetical protein